jgi:hypothetical protein
MGAGQPSRGGESGRSCGSSDARPIRCSGRRASAWTSEECARVAPGFPPVSARSIENLPTLFVPSLRRGGHASASGTTGRQLGVQRTQGHRLPARSTTTRTIMPPRAPSSPRPTATSAPGSGSGAVGGASDRGKRAPRSQQASAPKPAAPANECEDCVRRGPGRCVRVPPNVLLSPLPRGSLCRD